MKAPHFAPQKVTLNFIGRDGYAQLEVERTFPGQSNESMVAEAALKYATLTRTLTEENAKLRRDLDDLRDAFPVSHLVSEVVEGEARNLMGGIGGLMPAKNAYHVVIGHNGSPCREFVVIASSVTAAAATAASRWIIQGRPESNDYEVIKVERLNEDTEVLYA